MFLYVNSTDILRDWSAFPRDVRRKAKMGTLRLEELMALGSESKLEICVFCYDELSGSRKLFTSKPYTIDSIKNGPFDPYGMDVLETGVTSAYRESEEERS